MATNMCHNSIVKMAKYAYIQYEGDGGQNTGSYPRTANHQNYFIQKLWLN